LRVINLRWNNIDIGSLNDFREQQTLVQELCKQVISEKSDQSRQLFQTGIDEVLETIHKKVKEQSE
jgi:hypothetical protein